MYCVDLYWLILIINKRADCVFMNDYIDNVLLCRSAPTGLGDVGHPDETAQDMGQGQLAEPAMGCNVAMTDQDLQSSSWQTVMDPNFQSGAAFSGASTAELASHDHFSPVGTAPAQVDEANVEDSLNFVNTFLREVKKMLPELLTVVGLTISDADSAIPVIMLSFHG